MPVVLALVPQNYVKELCARIESAPFAPSEVVPIPTILGREPLLVRLGAVLA